MIYVSSVNGRAARSLMKVLNVEVRQSIIKKAEDLKDMWSILCRLSKIAGDNILNIAQILILYWKHLLYDRKPKNMMSCTLYNLFLPAFVLIVVKFLFFFISGIYEGIFTFTVETFSLWNISKTYKNRDNSTTKLHGSVTQL